MTNPLLTPSARSAGRIVVWVLFGLLVLAILAAAWVGVRGYLAYGHVRDAQQTVREIRANITDTEATSTRVAELAEQTSSAHSLTSDPVWRAAEYVPWVGEQLSAVSTAIATVDEVASSALGPLVEVTQDFSVEDLRPTDGRINVEALASVQDVAAMSAERVSRAADRIENIDRRPLLAPVAEQIDEVGEQLRTASSGADAITRASQLMPAMLGHEGPREYLLLFQNNAEARSLGGLVGAMALLRTDSGTISLESQSAAVEFPRFDEPVLPLSDDRAALFDNQPARWMSNVTQIPDFTVSAPLAQAMWERQTGQHVDGVIAVDPVALSYVLESIGPLTLPTGDVITSENAVQLLLNDPYVRFDDPRQQDEFFQATAAAIFDAMLSGAAEPGPLLDAFTRATREGRVAIWNENEADQAVLDGTPLQGKPLDVRPEQTTFGVFLNDGTPSKMSFYSRVTSGASWCTNESGGIEAVLEVALRNAAPPAAATLPTSITGAGRIVPRGSTRTVTYLYLPEGAEIVSATSSSNAGFGRGNDGDRSVLIWEAVLAPDEEVSATVRVSTEYTHDLRVVTTPTVPGGSETVTPPCSVTEAG
ncbi:DUF4012 domain-containing protein [Aeromicrobium phragmitis]|uniref:DUF4012 domain-containing protein n=1 Tax=Aeromicrobium phragmitis TaxID=2478914 RepID=A0A3L8PH74_9ACTN|nr:DUF4012 domain-containing protein [Aeromicrobium phragmitis]RLV54547.1 DUF4012 domain-containing protein [Aeromicrobium phragmitis]